MMRTLLGTLALAMATCSLGQTGSQFWGPVEVQARQVTITIHPRFHPDRSHLSVQTSGWSQGTIVASASSESDFVNLLVEISGGGASLDGANLIVENGSDLVDTWIAVKALRTMHAGTLYYQGFVAPGCGIKAGATSNQKLYRGALLPVPSILKVIAENLQKC